jgi:chromosome partitioning protein
VGNVKGGSGKSTTAMHIITRLMALGYRVNALDLDGQQSTLGRYLDNRALFAERKKIDVCMPQWSVHQELQGKTHKASRDKTYGTLSAALAQAMEGADCVVLDCPGADTFLGQLGHFWADTLITPLNDSFIDLDLLARCDPDTQKILWPGPYSEAVWHMRKRRFLQEGHVLDWLLLRNRVTHTDTRNKRAMTTVLKQLHPLLGSREGQGFTERVIFRELFLRGLTLSDLKRYRTGITMTMNHVAAHQEIKQLVAGLRLPPPAAQAVTEASAS